MKKTTILAALFVASGCMMQPSSSWVESYSPKSSDLKLIHGLQKSVRNLGKKFEDLENLRSILAEKYLTKDQKETLLIFRERFISRYQELRSVLASYNYDLSASSGLLSRALRSHTSINLQSLNDSKISQLMSNVGSLDIGSFSPYERFVFHIAFEQYADGLISEIEIARFIAYDQQHRAHFEIPETLHLSREKLERSRIERRQQHERDAIVHQAQEREKEAKSRELLELKEKSDRLQMVVNALEEREQLKQQDRTQSTSSQTEERLQRIRRHEYDEADRHHERLNHSDSNDSNFGTTAHSSGSSEGE